MSRPILVELSALDGAVVLSSKGELLAYGAVLQPRREGKARGSEGARTKAAMGASNYGVAIKVSSDGEISVFKDGKQLLAIGG